MASHHGPGKRIEKVPLLLTWQCWQRKDLIEKLLWALIVGSEQERFAEFVP
jgi:hypothetical protein